jgi:hypothetical protein
MAITLTEDILVKNGVAYLENSGDQSELTWIRTVLDSDEYVILDKYDVEDYPWETVEGENSIVASKLLGTPNYFFIKIGNGNIGGSDHYLYENIGELSWAVVDYSKWGYDDIKLVNIGRISHVGEVSAAPVPEPSTCLLLGFGLIGIAILGKKNFIKKG